MKVRVSTHIDDYHASSDYTFDTEAEARAFIDTILERRNDRDGIAIIVRPERFGRIDVIISN